MNNRQIETSREIRLWVTRVILPTFGVVMMVPKWREAVVTKTKEVAGTIKSKLHK